MCFYSGFCNGAEWFVSKLGNDTVGCGHHSNQCGSLRYVINNSQSGDVIKLTANQSETRSFHHCAEEPINIDLTLEGIGPEVPILYCEGTVLNSEPTPLVFHFQNNSATLTNLEILNSHILASNAKIKVVETTFNGSALFLMQPEIYSFYLDPHPLGADSLPFRMEFGYTYWHSTGELRDTLEEYKLTCFSVTLTVERVEWLPQKQEAPPPLDVPQGLGIQAACQKIHVTMTSSNLSDNLVFLFAVAKLNVSVTDTVFVGPGTGSPVQGGVKVSSFSLPAIRLQNCRFQDLKFSDLAFSQMAALNLLPAAFAVDIHKYGRSISGLSVQQYTPYQGHIQISNCSFESNFRAIGIKSKFPSGLPLEVSILDSLFRNNQIVSDGGAFLLDEGENVTVKIVNTDFVSNDAGVNAFDSTLEFPGIPLFRIQNEGPKAHDFRFLSRDSLRLDLEFIDATLDDVTYVNRSVFLSLRGSGGALAVKSAYWFVLKHCKFINNTASSTGGAIFAGNDVDTIRIEDVSFINGPTHPSLTSGAILQSSSRGLTLHHAYLEMLDVSESHTVSALHHSGEKMSVSFKLQNITVVCPINAQLRIFNTTNDIKDMHEAVTVPKPDMAFNDLVYTCALCSGGSYSFESGYFRHASDMVIGRRKRSLENGTSEALTFTALIAPPPPPPPPPPAPNPTPPSSSTTIIHMLTYTDVICHPCPYGGVCVEGIRAKANNWGTQINHIVTFYKCPHGYCCAQPVCDTYNQCREHRTGTLCSQCEPGFTEALFSTSCIPEEDCNQIWFIPISIILIVLYAIFLMYQNDLKDFLLGAPIGSKTLKRTLSKWAAERKIHKEPRVIKVTEPAPPEETVTAEPETPGVQGSTDEGGIFLILLFYYFQDASIVTFTPIFAQAQDPIEAVIKKFMGGLFKFQLDVLIFAGNICPFPGLNPVNKVWLKLLFVPALLVLLLSVYGFSKFLSRRKSRGGDRWNHVAGKTSMALVFATLFSYQRLAMSAFGFMYCVPVGSESVLFIDGSVRCLATWQVVVLVHLLICIIPFGLYITIIPSLLLKGQIGLMPFFLGCLFPLPMLVVKLLQRLCAKDTDSALQPEEKTGREGKLVYGILQGPYREYVIKTRCFQTGPLCWSGVLLLRRLLLIIAHTYVHSIMLRLLIMTLISIIALLHHLTVHPCKEQRANTAGTISCTALLLVSIINLVRATFEAAEFIPEAGLRAIMDALHLVEDSLLFWVPLVGVSVIILFLCAKLLSVCVSRTWSWAQRDR